MRLNKLLKLSERQFPHQSSGQNNTSPASFAVRIKITLTLESSIQILVIMITDKSGYGGNGEEDGMEGFGRLNSSERQDWQQELEPLRPGPWWHF